MADDAEVLFGGELHVDAGRLEDDSDIAPDLGGLAGDVVAQNESSAGGGDHQSRENTKRGGLAAAVGAEQAEDFGRADVEGNVVQGGAIAVLMMKVLELNGGSGAEDGNIFVGQVGGFRRCGFGIQKNYLGAKAPISIWLVTARLKPRPSKNRRSLGTSEKPAQAAVKRVTRAAAFGKPTQA